MSLLVIFPSPGALCLWEEGMFSLPAFICIFNAVAGRKDKKGSEIKEERDGGGKLADRKLIK